MKEITIIAYTHLAGQLAHQVMTALRKNDYLAQAYLFEKYEVDGCVSFSKGQKLVKASFEKGNPILFICATGIAVRLIAPFIKSKVSDVPVVVMDEKGQYAIPILSGHLGGANEYARLFATLTGGTSVITTATDLHQQFAIDLFAKENNLYITDMEKAKRISARVLHEGMAEGQDAEKQAMQKYYVISPYLKDETDEKLLLVPKQLVIGIGCKKDTSSEKIKVAIEEVFKEKGLHLKAILKICSIDLKKDELGLVTYCKQHNLPYETFSAEALMDLEGIFTASPFVKSITGVDNVCERSAMLGCDGQGQLIVPKQKMNGVTIAVALIM